MQEQQRLLQEVPQLRDTLQQERAANAERQAADRAIQGNIAVLKVRLA